MKSPIKKHLTITKTEWNGLVVLLLLIITVLAAPYIYRYVHKDEAINFGQFDKAVAQLKKAGVTGNNVNDEDEGNNPSMPARLFAFNPNKLPVTQWQKLGLNLRQIKGIKNYEAKGGRFYIKADVQKMYTLTPQIYQRLEPYINLPSAAKHDAEKPLVRVELNTADSATLIRLKGIGPAFARRIIQYRNRLGGFHSKQQLKEIFGMDDMRYQDIQAQFIINPRKVKKLNVNTIEFNDLKNFPYLSYKQANALIQYRKQHGNYETFNELGNVAILDMAVLKKIKPYIIVR